MHKTYPLFDIYWDQSDIEHVVNVISRGSYWAVGPEIEEFEKDLCTYFKANYAICFNSGTSALHAVLLAYGITSGEVIVPSFTFISTANAVILSGATPVFADIENETFGLDPADVERKITDKTKAIIPVHYGGKICRNILQLRTIADIHHILLIEDNAESFGAKITDQFAGMIGHSGMVSFCQNKIITTGEGGAIITQDEKIAKALRLIRSHGRVESNVDYFKNIYIEDYIEIGYNYRMPTMCAALGISQLKKIDTIIELRRKVGHYYDEKLKSIPQLQILPEIKNTRNVYQLYTVILKDSSICQKLQEYLVQLGIYTKIYFAPIHLKSFYRSKYGYKEGFLPNTENLSKCVLTLPISLHFTEEDQNYIAKAIESYFKK